MSDQIIEKTCSKCGETSPATTEFFPWRKSKNRFDSWCRLCYRANAARFRTDHPELVKERDRAYKARTCEANRLREKRRRETRSLTEKQLAKEHARTHNNKLKLEALEHYGGAFCQCCGETQLLMLALDHIESNGADHRRELTGGRSMPGSSYVWAKKNNWPPIFKTMCHSCNFARHWTEGQKCPHQIEREALWQSFIDHVTPQQLAA